MPILGIWASQILAPVDSYTSLATVNVGAGGVASVSFTGISSAYKHLQLVVSARHSAATTAVQVNLNSDSGANYIRHAFVGNGTTVSSTAGQTQTYLGIGNIPTTANTFYTTVLDILDYASTTKTKTTRNFYGYDSNGTGEVGQRANNWNGTGAITSIVFTLPSGNFAQYSQFALYGIR